MSFPGAPAHGAPPQGGTGAAMHPRPMMGSAAQGMTMVRLAVEALQKSLPALPMGSELHTAVLKCVTDLSRRMESGGGGAGDAASKTQALAQMAQANQQPNPMEQAMAKMGAGGQPQAPQPPSPAAAQAGGQ